LSCLYFFDIEKINVHKSQKSDNYTFESEVL